MKKALKFTLSKKIVPEISIMFKVKDTESKKGNREKERATMKTWNGKTPFLKV